MGFSRRLARSLGGNRLSRGVRALTFALFALSSEQEHYRSAGPQERPPNQFIAGSCMHLWFCWTRARDTSYDARVTLRFFRIFSLSGLIAIGVTAIAIGRVSHFGDAFTIFVLIAAVLCAKFLIQRSGIFGFSCAGPNCETYGTRQGWDRFDDFEGAVTEADFQRILGYSQHEPGCRCSECGSLFCDLCSPTARGSHVQSVGPQNWFW